MHGSCSLMVAWWCFSRAACILVHWYLPWLHAYIAVRPLFTQRYYTLATLKKLPSPVHHAAVQYRVEGIYKTDCSAVRQVEPLLCEASHGVR